MNSFRSDKVFNLDADRGKYILKDVFNFLPLGALRAREGRQQEVNHHVSIVSITVYKNAKLPSLLRFCFCEFSLVFCFYQIQTFSQMTSANKQFLGNF
jgi:hypothetical protein